MAEEIKKEENLADKTMTPSSAKTTKEEANSVISTKKNAPSVIIDKPKPDAKSEKPKSKKSESKGIDKITPKESAGTPKKTTTKNESGYEARLKIRYRDVITGEMHKEFSYKSPMQIPKLEKIVVSAGVGEAIANKKFLDSVIMELEQITGQKVLRTKATKSIANFKVRAGMEVGAKVTLRGNRMYEFLDRLLNIALPRVKDFRGVSPKSFDGRGNYSIGIDEQIIFPEIDYDKIEKVRGLNVVIATTAVNDDQARSLLGKMGMPFRKE